MLAGWEAYAHDALILPYAIQRHDSLRVSPGKIQTTYRQC